MANLDQLRFQVNLAGVFFSKEESCLGVAGPPGPRTGPAAAGRRIREADAHPSRCNLSVPQRKSESVTGDLAERHHGYDGMNSRLLASLCIVHYGQDQNPFYKLNDFKIEGDEFFADQH